MLKFTSVKTLVCKVATIKLSNWLCIKSPKVVFKFDLFESSRRAIHLSNRCLSTSLARGRLHNSKHLSEIDSISLSVKLDVLLNDLSVSHKPLFDGHFDNSVDISLAFVTSIEPNLGFVSMLNCCKLGSIESKNVNMNLIEFDLNSLASVSCANFLTI